ncbi:MAG: hypothetical protein ACM3SR_10945 [Ignavibacteriales bacterium]
MAVMILHKLYNLSLGNQLKGQRQDRLFVELNNERPRYIQRSLFDSGLNFAVYKNWIEYGETHNEVLTTVDGRIELLTRRILGGICGEL